jgi:hypothetical protein
MWLYAAMGGTTTWRKKMMKLIPLRTLALPAVVGVAACGSLAANADKPSTLATVTGSIENPNPNSTAVASDAAFRVAVVWVTSGQALGDGGYADDHRTTQDIAVTPKFPAKFQLDLTELPSDLQPFQELFGGSPSVNLRGVAGFVVAYEDVNRNGKLDLVTSSSPGFIDRVLGESNYPLLYLEGTMPTDSTLIANAKDAGGHLPHLGFNLVRNYCSMKTPPAGSACDALFDWVPVSTPTTIELSADAMLANIMCAEMPSGAKSANETTHPAGELPAALPSAGDPNVKCATDGRSYTYTADKAVTPPGICQATTTYHNVDTYSLVAGATAATGWPCTVQ